MGKLVGTHDRKVGKKQELRYQVTVNGLVLKESANLAELEQFIEGLAVSLREQVSIIPIKSDGNQLLLG